MKLHRRVKPRHHWLVTIWLNYRALVQGQEYLIKAAALRSCSECGGVRHGLECSVQEGRLPILLLLQQRIVSILHVMVHSKISFG